LKKSWIHNGTVLIRVSANHFAFLRGYLQGLDLAVLSKRYLETAVSPDPELRVARSTLKWIREQLMTAARRRGHFPDARLILIDPEKLRQAARKAVPNLEEFREQRDPHELYSEAELIELFEEEFGSHATDDRRSQRNERLRRRQLNVLTEFEKLLGTPPALDDEVGGWLDPALAQRLNTAGLRTLGQLVETINGRGYRWWIHVPRFGEKAATQVVAWLRTETVERALGVRLGIQASTKASRVPVATLKANRPKQTGIVPLEHMALPPELDGSGGMNRGTTCMIAATNDLEAIDAWLQQKPAGSSTWRSYRKEAERFLLWAVVERQRPLSSLAADDCVAYCDFLRKLDPGATDAEWRFRLPPQHWCAPRGTKRWSPFWRPFEGALSVESGNLAITILTSMCRWLAACGYLASNPWENLSQRMRANRQSAGEKGFSSEQWNVLLDYLETLPNDAKYERLRFILVLCRDADLRLSELIRARIAHLACRQKDGVTDAGDTFLLVGRTEPARQIPLAAATVAALDRYLAHRGLADHLSCDGATFLIGRLPSDRPAPFPPDPERPALSANALYQILKRFFLDAATALENSAAPVLHSDSADTPDSIADKRQLAERMRRASTEWLRHTNGA
jgi:site-specific recombinase XerD